MPNAFVAKLCGHGLLPSEDMSLLDSACGTQRDVPAQQDLIREGDEPGTGFRHPQGLGLPLQTASRAIRNERSQEEEVPIAQPLAQQAGEAFVGCGPNGTVDAYAFF